MVLMFSYLLKLQSSFSLGCSSDSSLHSWLCSILLLSVDAASSDRPSTIVSHLMLLPEHDPQFVWHPWGAEVTSPSPSLFV